MTLAKLYEEHHKEENLGLDPVGWLDRSLSDKDLELLSFLLQGLSYGRVEQIKVSFDKLLAALQRVGIGQNGEGLYLWLQENNPHSKEFQKSLRGWKHRLNVAKDIQDVLAILKTHVVLKNRSIAEWFASLDAPTFQDRLVSFCSYFENPSSNKKTAVWRGTGASWFAPSPQNGGTSKRLLMWLRWMMREDLLDLGLWQRLLPKKASISKADLLIPVDTHVFKFAKRWNIVTHNSPTWKSVLKITEALKQVDQNDPIKFDFSICHAGKLESRKPL